MSLPVEEPDKGDRHPHARRLPSDTPSSALPRRNVTRACPGSALDHTPWDLVGAELAGQLAIMARPSRATNQTTEPQSITRLVEL